MNKQVDELTQEELFNVYSKAFTWNHDHADLVERLIANAKGKRSVAPCGSDIFHPELWKDIHWKWFKNLGTMVFEVSFFQKQGVQYEQVE
jgi:hypothetical protein